MRRLVLLAVVVVFGGLFLWACLRSPAETPRPGPSAAPDGAPPPLSGRDALPLPTAPTPGRPEELARPSCVGDLLAVDQAPGFDGVRAAFARGLVDDPAVAAYLSDLVAERIGDDPEAALAVLAWAKEASDEEAEILLAGLAKSAGAKDPRVGEGLVALGGDAGASERVRRAALDALRTQPRLDEAGRAKLRELALEGSSDELAWHATRALGSVMNESVAKTGEFRPYWDELEKIARTSPDSAVRALALEAPMHSDPILPKEKIDTLVDIMLDEPHRDVRELAAFQLGLTESPRDALEAFRRAFEQEYDECVRWAIVRFAVRAAGVDALPLLEHFARIDPAFVQDLQDFRAIFAAGHVDFERIWLAKPERHACVVEHGELHGGE